MRPSASGTNSKNNPGRSPAGKLSPQQRPPPKTVNSKPSVKLKHGPTEPETDSTRPSTNPGRVPPKPSGASNSGSSATTTPKKKPQDSVPAPKNPPLSSGSSTSFIRTTVTPGKKSKKGTKPTPTSQQQSRLQLSRKGECEICKQSCRSHCAGCKQVFYCCKQHQQQHWPKHKLICRPFSIPTQYSSSFHLRPPVASSSTLVNNGGTVASGPETAPELRFMISTKVINPGQVLFTEKPLLVAANVFSTESTSTPPSWCCSCLHPFLDINNNNDASGKKSTTCSTCEITLCQLCKSDQSSSSGATNKFLPGQGHSKEECALIAGLRQKANVRVEKSDARNLIMDLTALRVLMFRTAYPWRWESIIALRNCPRYTACCKHNFIGGSNVDESHYPVAAHYIKNVCKEKNIQLVDILRIVTIFSEECAHNPNLIVLYENLSWMAHACTPNAEKFSRHYPAPSSSSGSDIKNNDNTDNSSQDNFEIVVKSVNTIRENDKITMNYISGYDGGRSTLALRLFQRKGLYCCDSNCACYQKGPDKTLGIRCDRVFSNIFGNAGDFNSCSGILTPKVDVPNPDKSNLGLGMFMKSRRWDCSKCTKSEKYEDLHPVIIESIKELSNLTDKCCNDIATKPQAFLQLQSRFTSTLSEQHWMVWKAKRKVLQAWNEVACRGYQMLQRAVSLPKGASRDHFLHIVKQKVDLYGSSIYSMVDGDNNKKNNVNKKEDLLSISAARYGELSPKRSELLLDAFHANLILFMEDYTKELPLPQVNSKCLQIARENCKKLMALRELCTQSLNCLKLYEGTTEVTDAKRVDYTQLRKMVSTSLDSLTKLCSRVQKIPSKILEEMNDMLELYAYQDVKFINNHIPSSRPRRDPFRAEVAEELEFEIDSDHVGSLASYSFKSPKEGSFPSGSC